MVEKGEFINFIKNLEPIGGLTTDMSIMKELAEKIDILEERIIKLEGVKVNG